MHTWLVIVASLHFSNLNFSVTLISGHMGGSCNKNNSGVRGLPGADKHTRGGDPHTAPPTRPHCCKHLWVAHIILRQDCVIHSHCPRSFEHFDLSSWKSDQFVGWHKKATHLMTRLMIFTQQYYALQLIKSNTGSFKDDADVQLTFDN